MFMHRRDRHESPLLPPTARSVAMSSVHWPGAYLSRCLSHAMELRGPAFSGLANLRLSYAAAFISRYPSMASCGVWYPIAE